ncbi:hypothetical protein [Pseudomonas sp. DR48]|uniref:hypothetical protein n=1 Tax=Pseudomonas sp. DR48 TaxID=2871095 RepID=UPI0039656F4C
MGKRASLHTTSLRDRSLVAKQAIVAGVLRDAWPHIEAGRVVPVIDDVFNFEEIVEAHRHTGTQAHRHTGTQAHGLRRSHREDRRPNARSIGHWSPL